MKKQILGMAMIAGLVSAARGDIHLKPIFEGRSNELIRVEGDWKSDCPKRIKVSVRVDEDTPSKEVTIKAYFYDAQNNRIAKFNAPSQIWKNTGKGFAGVALPEILPKNREVEVFFPVTAEIEKVWRSVIVVCSDASMAVARSRPPAAVETIDFPDKGSVKLIRN